MQKPSSQPSNKSSNKPSEKPVEKKTENSTPPVANTTSAVAGDAKEPRKMLIVDETPAQKTEREAKEKEAAELEAKKAEAAKPAKVSSIVVEQTPHGPQEFRKGTVVYDTFKMFTLPLASALTFDQIVDELLRLYPNVSRERHAFTVRSRTTSFMRHYGMAIGVDEAGRCNVNIQGKAKLARAQSAEKAKEKADKAAAKAAAKEAAAKVKAESKATKEKAKADAKAAKEAAQKAAAEAKAKTDAAAAEAAKATAKAAADAAPKA